jgi:hypothetical protein
MDIKGVLRIHKSKNRQLNGQKKKDKQRSTKHTHKTKDRVITGGELRCSRRVSFTTEAVCQRNSSETTEQNFMKLGR